MKIGIFDSGLGGLDIAKAVIEKLPQYDYIYLGDTKNLPYGDKTFEQVYNYTEKAIDFLLKKDCAIVIVACNTASSKALRTIQQNFLPKKFPNRKVLGVIIPAVEEVIANNCKKVGMISTSGTKKSKTFDLEIEKSSQKLEIKTIASPKLVPLIEANKINEIDVVLKEYIEPVKDEECLILGCTHYALIEDKIRKLFDGKLIIQNKIIPEKFEKYLTKHGEIKRVLTTKSTRTFFLTKFNVDYEKLARQIYREKNNFQLAVL